MATSGNAPIRSVIFDVGNTLWFEAVSVPRDDFEQVQAQRVALVAREWGIMPRCDIAQVQRDVWEAYDALWTRERRRETYREHVIPELLRAALDARGIGITADQAYAWHRAAWLRPHEFGMQLYPDALDVLRELKERGFLVAVNTNRPCTNDILEVDLGSMGVMTFVDAMVCSGDVGFFKPHQAPFEAALRALGLEPAQALMVGDSLERDVRPARALGMSAVWKLNGRYDIDLPDDAGATIHDLNELLALPDLGGTPRTLESATPHEDDNAGRF
jgi:HAD superfamily hydrolase (TIGR01509 family)